MEILQKFKKNGFFTADLYHLLAKKRMADVSEEIVPSEYAKEMKMSTTERLQALNRIVVDNISSSSGNNKQIVLSFTPSILVFQNFNTNEKHVGKFCVKNISKAPTYINMVWKESLFFSIKPCAGKLLSRLAPGISVAFSVTFQPVQYEDCIHKVVFYTDTDQYILPIIAMGPRPIVDFPDEIRIPKTPLKIENHVFITIHNLGLVPAGFTFNTRCPFSVQPKSARLRPNEKLEVKVIFKTMRLGDIQEILYAVFETGENFRIKLYGSTHTASVEMEKQVVRFLDTYNTMARQQTFKITNKSNHILTYVCMKNQSVFYDFEDKVKLATAYYGVKEIESAKSTKLVEFDVVSSDEHHRVYTRIFYDEIQALIADETLYFQNMHFSITPIEGKLWPGKSTEIIITFSPKEIGEFETTVYLDIDGITDRVPLKLVGISLPPTISLNLETLDMDCVYINKIYNYEVLAINKGHIDGVIVYKDVPPLFGSVITCTPQIRCLRPGEKEIFVISFCNSNQGPYFEEINFVIQDTEVVLKLYLKGVVIYPSLSFSIPCLDFGMVSVGVPKSLEVDVLNESIVYVTGSLKISSDGPEISSITLTDYAVAEKPKPQIPQWPREFCIEPAKINIEPESRISLKVTLTANLVRANQTSLELELEKSDSPPITLPVTFNAMVPEITPAQDIILRAAFLDFAYQHEIYIKSNDIRGYFTIEEPKEQSTLEVEVETKEGMIEPNSTLCLQISIKTSVLGMQEYYIRMFLFGLTNPVEICHITGCGVRPIVTCSPTALHWGQVKILNRTHKTLTLCNDSPVKVNFKASLVNRDGRWHINPTEGFIDPESETDLFITLYLIDADSYTNKAIIQLEKVKDILVPLSATGIGTSILIGDLRDKVNIGRHFTRIPLNHVVNMENCGTRMHALEWSEHYKAPKTKQNTTGFFNLEPRVFKMAAGEKVELNITGLSYKVSTVKEMWYLVGSVEGINKKELLLECQIIAEFVDPKIEVSTSMLDFQYDYGPYSEYYKLTDILTIKNISKLPLDFEISVKPPFAIVQKHCTYKVPPHEQHLCGCIYYNENDLNLPNICNDFGPQRSRQFIDYLTLKPVEPAKKSPYQFFQDINKIKLVFSLTHIVEERLEDQEVMKIQILFDTTKHLSLKSRVYCDLMKVKFKGHKNKDAIKLVGKINFPNIFIWSPKVDFQCIQNGSIESRTIKIQNVTPLLACYKFNWKKYLISTTDSVITKPDPIRKKIAQTSTTDTEPSVADLHEIMACQTPAGSTADKILEFNCLPKEVASSVQDPTTLYSLTLDEDLESLKKKIIKKIAPMIDTEYDTQFEWISKFPNIPRRFLCINDILQLSPHRGLLKPNEIQYVQIIFRPKPNINVRAVLECEVLGGPSESIIVTGQSSDLMYKINTLKVNFKIRSFHENAIENLILTNISQLPFVYKSYLNETDFENGLNGCILDLIPQEKSLEPEEELVINIEVNPGITGYFNRVFLLEIGHFPFIPIEVFGWGVIPQIYLSLPRSGVDDLSPELGYLAIPTLTSEYLESINEFMIKDVTEHANSPLTEKCFEDTTFNYNWHICSSWDGYPSTMDIELAIERMLLVNHIKKHPEILNAYSTNTKMGPIAGFITTPYVIDYGVIITGSTVQCSVEIVNYGPIASKLHFAKGTNVPTWLGLKLCGKLGPGEKGKLDVIFSPTANDFTELEQDVATSFNLEVPYGVTIPVQIKALCAVPYLVSNVATIDFGSVRCGNKVVCSIPLKNVGKPTCIWYVNLRLKTPGPNPMLVLDNSGKYEPGEGGWLSIAFKPTLEMAYEGVLSFRFHMNPIRLSIPVIGQGILPQVHPIGPNIIFPPTLPWAKTVDMYFGLTNPCPFPIELIIAHSDVKWKEEEEMYQLLYKYYNKPEEMLVPAIKPGAGLPCEIISFNQKFKERVKKCVEDEAMAMAMTMKTSVGKGVIASKKIKSPKTPAKSTPVKEPVSPRKFRTEAEILADEMKNMKENNVDPLKECLHVFDRVSADASTEKYNKGFMLFFHGSPCEELQGQEMSYAISKKLGLPTINVDLCIVEALCVCSCPAKTILTSTIHEMYFTSRSGASKIDSDDNEEYTEDMLEDEFESILKKIEFLATNKNVGTPRSRASDKKKKKSPTSSLGSHTAVAGMGSSTMFHMELLQELLVEYFGQSKFDLGFVVDTLSSIVIKSPSLVLTTIIKCKQSIRNIHLVLCHSDFYKWAQAQEDLQRENDLMDECISKVYSENEIDQIVKDFEAMTEEEYDQASPELKSIFIAYGLENRRNKYFEKIGCTSDYIKTEKNAKDHSKSNLHIDTSETKKKMKKDDAKAKPTSEFLTMNTKYNEYTKNIYDNLINIANNWNIEEHDVAYPLIGFNGQLVGAEHRKAKKKSDVQLQLSTISISERGFPLTLVMCPCLRYKQASIDMFAKSELVKKALRQEEKFDILSSPIIKKEYTVLLPKNFPVLQHEKSLQWLYLDEPPLRKCECNQLTDLNLLDDLSQDNVLNILSKWHCTCGKKVTSSQTSTSEIPSISVEKVISEESESYDMYPIPLSGVKTTEEHDNRIVLQPGDLVRCKYSFSPRTEGNFSVKRFVEVSGWPESRIDITVSGICDLPRLDSRPKKMFENFIRRTLEDHVYKVTYLDDRKLFEFGPIFIGGNRIYEEDYTVDLKNSSLITTDVDIEFYEDTVVFQIDKQFMRLEPGCREKLKISAAPTEIGIHNVILLFCVKDNPEIITVNIACSGVVPVVEILPLSKQIEYGKLLLYRREDDRLIVKNDSILSIMWKLRNAEEFVQDFIIAKTYGIVPRHDNQVVPITYIACRVGVIVHKPLLLDIYDAEGRGDPMITDTLYLSAECYDVTVECVYDNPNDNFLNYGNVKVNSTVVREMYLLNRGRYNIYYKLKKVKDFPEPSLLRSFEAIPECGVIPPTIKLTTIEFECTPTTSMNLVNVPAYTCTLLDGSRHQVVVAKFPVCVTIASFYNTFTLFPLGELNFHIIPVGSGVMRDVILNNTSKCPVTYEIVLPPEYQPDSNPSLPVKLKDNKIKNPPIKCGNFVIMNEDNLLAPGTSRTIQIQFFATAARTFEEIINFVISDTCPAEAQGVPLKLVGTGAIPTLDFWNLENTFREHLIVKNMSEYKVPESSPHCVFVEDTVTLHFFSVTVNSSNVAVVDLYNNGLVACALTMKLHYQSNSNQNIFSLDKYETHIEPLLHKNLEIIFSPKALEEYRAVLEIKLKQLDNQEQSFKICLIGEGVIPRIRLLHPPLRKQRIASLHFPVTCLGSLSSKVIRFKNVSAVKANVKVEILQSLQEARYVFLLSLNSEINFMDTGSSYDESLLLKVTIIPKEVASIYVIYNPIRRGRANCEVKLSICDNPYEYFSVLCEAESFMEDVILMGLEMLSMDIDLEAYKTSIEGTVSTVSTVDSRKKSKSAPLDKKKSKQLEGKRSKKGSQASMKHSDTTSVEHSMLKYVLDFGGCELCSMQKRSIIMVNNSEKVYKFKWGEVDHVVVKPSVGYISPGEEKDLEIIFFAAQPVVIKKECLNLELSAMDNDSLTINLKGNTWDNRQTVTIFDHNRDVSLNERYEAIIDEQGGAMLEVPLETVHMVIVYSAMTDYTKYKCTLKEEMRLKDTFIYQTREFQFKVENIGKVSMKIAWSFVIDEEFPARIDKKIPTNERNDGNQGQELQKTNKENDPSKVTLFSQNSTRDSVDTWFEVDLPFTIEPMKECLKPNESRVFKVTFAPLDAFDFKVKLKSIIDNLDPYDQNISCKIMAKSLIPYVHLDIEESDYLTSGRRKVTGVALPRHVTVLEFNVLGSGCYKKSFSVINPTSEAYEFIFEMILSDKPELIPVHCNKLKGYVEGGSSTDVVFTFSPTAPGVYESQWKFIIPVYSLVMNLMVVGLVREPEVMFVPTILIIRNSLVGFTSNHIVVLKNNENEQLNFEFKGNSLCNESGKTPVIIEPEQGVLKPHSETKIKIIYTPIQDGPLSFKIFCSVTYLTKYLTLCVNALSYLIKPKVTYYLIGNEHVLNGDAVTNIHLDQTASTYERTIPFTIRNDGSATFFFDWHYNTSAVKKYLQVKVVPSTGHVTPADVVDCILHFTLKQVPVQAFPVTLSISKGPEYSIFLHANIEKPLYDFSCMEYDFGKCIVNAPDTTYKKNIAFNNNDKIPLILDLNFTNLPELFIQYNKDSSIQPNKRLKISIYFRPKQVKEYEFKLQFWVNSLCEEIITIKGEGVPLLYDLYEGCQKSFDLGPVKVGEKIVRQIDVMNHSKVPIDATFIFRDMYHIVEDHTKSEGTSACLSPSMASVQGGNPGQARGHMLQQYKEDKIQEQIEMDIENALSSLKVIPNKCFIKPYCKVPLKIQFKPIGMISNLNVQLNMKVFDFERPLVRLSGSATGMSLCLSQNSLQFGRVRKRGCKILKVMLQNKGDFGTRFCWQPLVSNEFTISPMQGNIAAHTNVTFTITFRPLNHNPFIKAWASCNLDNYRPLELALYATCMDIGNVQNKTLYLECPVREIRTDYVIVTNPTDDMWLVLSEVSGGPFETLREFNVEPNSTFEIPIHFKPKSIGKHESQVLFSPLGESALFIAVVGFATHPNPNSCVSFSVPAKEFYTKELLVYNITESPESYVVSTEIVKIVPEKFEGYYEIKHPESVKVWGETAATCRWTIVCYEECEIHTKVMFINEVSREYQYYDIVAMVTPSKIVDTLTFVSRARETVQRELVIVNPLSSEAEFCVSCDKLQCPDLLTIARNSEATLVMTYSPLVVGETVEFLEVKNQLIGSYLYKVVLRCLPAKEKNLEFTTTIGSCLPLRLRVHNKTDVKTDFYATVSHPSVLTEREYTLGPFEKGKFQAWFEPIQLGVQNCKVSFDSSVAGEFVFNIKGTATNPKPQGPYEIKPGGFTTIKFKNVFEEPRMFKIQVDRDEFYVKTTYEPIKSKKDIKIMVYLNDIPAQSLVEMPTGSLTVETYEPADPKVHWTYFLQGIP